MSAEEASCAAAQESGLEGERGATATNPLAGRVTAFTAACLLVSNMVGTGIFGTTGFMAADLGSPGVILALWLLGGVFALFGAFSYGELAAAFPRSGGEYIYIREAYGPLWGFLSGWTSLTIGFSAAIASSAHLFGDHVRELVPAFGAIGGSEASEGTPVIGLSMVWILTLIHVAGVGAGGFTQRFLTVLKIAALVALVLLGVSFGTGDWQNLAASDVDVSFGLGTVLVAFMFVTFSFTGWNAATYIAGEVRTPQRSVPRSMVWGVLAVTVLYVALNAVYLYALPMSALASEPMDLVGHKTAWALFGPGAGRWFTLIVAVSIVGAASAMIWAGPRVYHAMAVDGLFPRAIGRTASRSGVPRNAIVLQGVWITVLVVSGTFETLVLYATFVLIFFSALAVSSVFVLRLRRPDLPRPYRVWAYPWIPAAYLLVSVAILWAALQIRPTESLWGVATVAAGIPVYLWMARSDEGRRD
ncbi:MAG: APC family permease [marine benthic group bacterium]|nr:APC family permease [Gemmatimonadota bacterium]